MHTQQIPGRMPGPGYTGIELEFARAGASPPSPFPCLVSLGSRDVTRQKVGGTLGSMTLSEILQELPRLTEEEHQELREVLNMAEYDKPKVVGPSFWLQRGIELRSGAVASRIATAKSLTAGIAWFWSAYTAVAVVGVSISTRQFTLVQSFWLAIPAVLLVAAYGAALWSQSHVAVEFMPNSPSSVERAHNEIAHKLKWRLIYAAALTALAVASVAVAIVVTAVSTPAETAGVPKLIATVLRREDQQPRLLVSGIAAADATVLIEVGTGEGGPPKNLQTGSDKKGAWSVEMPAVGKGPWSVSATWTSANMETRLRIDSVK
jgi:hypothetical protein